MGMLTTLTGDTSRVYSLRGSGDSELRSYRVQLKYGADTNSIFMVTDVCATGDIRSCEPGNRLEKRGR